jgi:hypothetical protein
VRAVELALAIVFVLAAIRSLWTWTHRPIGGADVADHVLFAIYVTGRVGMWLALAGYFGIAASIETRGRAAADELGTYRWFLLVPLVFAALQLVAGWFLGRRRPVSRG